MMEAITGSLSGAANNDTKPGQARFVINQASSQAVICLTIASAEIP